MESEGNKVHIILNAVSLAICLVGLGYCIREAIVENARWTGVWLFGILSVFWICLIIARAILQKNSQK